MSRCQRSESSYRLIRALVVLSLGTLLGAGCAARPQVQMSPPETTVASPVMTQINNALTSAALRSPSSTADYRLGPQDLLEITLFNVEQGSQVITGLLPRTTQMRVSEEGSITLPLLGDISVAGLTPSVLEQTLRQRYDEYIYNPQVGVQVKEYKSQRISLVGAVRQPGVFTMTGPNTLVDLLAMAGGITERAGNQVLVHRQGKEERHTHVVDLQALAGNPTVVNMPVQPGDVIEVPQAGTFFVDGAVLKPGSYLFSRPYTLTQALVVAGGINTNLSDESNVTILRRRGSLEVNRISVDLKQIQAGNAADLPVEPDDVIVVPINSGKWFLERFIGKIGLPGLPRLPPL
jgi:polysaccharide biosynthesis/export protein